MAHILLQHAVLPHPRTAKLRKRRERLLRPVRPSRRNELWYRAELGTIVKHLRKAGADIAAGLRPMWLAARARDARDHQPTVVFRDPLLGLAFRDPLRVAVVDERAPGLDKLLAQAAARFGNIRGVAQRLATLAARMNLGEVDRRLAASVLASVGVDISPALSDLSPSARGMTSIREVMAEKTAENVDLIRSIPEQYFDQIAEVVSSAWEAGSRWETVADQIQERGDVTESRARLIARDQTSKMNAAFNEVRQSGLGIEKYTWSTAGDERVRAEHADLDGQTFRWDDPPDVDGEAAHPGEPINCRCIALPVLDVDQVPGEGEEGEGGEGEGEGGEEEEQVAA